MAVEFLMLARAMAVDRVTAEVVLAMRAAGLDPVLIKGPTLGQWLYDDHEPRVYQDSDLLVDLAHQELAGRVLSDLGFERRHYEWEERRRLFHAGAWVRDSDNAVVDLHLTLPGISGASPEEVWEALRSRTVPWSLPGGAVVRAPDLGARALLAGLHAVHHFEHGAPERPLADLERAVAVGGLDTWTSAAELAVELRAGADLARALYAVAGGEELARAIGLTTPATGLNETTGIERILATRGAGERARAFRRALFPAPSYMRYWLPFARRGPFWLALAYLRRPFVLARSFPKAYRTWRSTRVDGP